MTSPTNDQKAARQAALKRASEGTPVSNEDIEETLDNVMEGLLEEAFDLPGQDDAGELSEEKREHVKKLTEQASKRIPNDKSR